MIRTGTHIVFVSTLVIASILTWGLSQGEAKPEHSAKHIQVHRLPKATRRVAIHIDANLQIAPVIKSLHLTEAVANKNQCKLRDYPAVESQDPVCESASTGESREDVDGRSSPAEIKVTPDIGDIMNKVRPKQITGIIIVEGKEYEFGSGGHGQSIPYGDYLITPDAVGSWGSKHGAIGVSNGSMPDPKLRRDRDGIELHAATNSKLETHGCVSIRKDQWPEFREQVLAMVRENKWVYLHVSDQGASVSTNPFEFIGETVSEPTFRDVLRLIEEPVGKAPEITPSRRCCRVMRNKAKHTHEVVRTTHSQRHGVNRRRA